MEAIIVPLLLSPIRMSIKHSLFLFLYIHPENAIVLYPARNPEGKICLSHSSCGSGDLCCPAHDQECGHALHAERRSQVRMQADVDSQNHKIAGSPLSQIYDHRMHNVTGSTSRRVKVHQNRKGRFLNEIIELMRCWFED